MKIATSILLAAIGLTGCSSDYPFDKPGTWSLPPTTNLGTANDTNLRAMVADPHDLVEGRGTSDSLSAEAAPPVIRLAKGKRTPLPNSSISTLQVESSQQPPTAATDTTN